MLSAKIAVLGAEGMAGSMITSILSKYHSVKPFGRADFDVVSDPIPDFRSYDFVINCIGLIKQKSSDENLLFKINSEFPQKLAICCNQLIHLSSDCVFSGHLVRGSYKSTDTPDADDNYGKSKARGEPGNAMVLRTSIIGPSKDNYGLFEWFRNTKENPIHGFTNHWWSGITTLELAKLINNIIKMDMYKIGLYQISSGKISKYQLLYLINQIFNLNKTIVPIQSDIMINRVLEGTVNTIDIEHQLVELKKFSYEKS